MKSRLVIKKDWSNATGIKQSINKLTKLPWFKFLLAMTPTKIVPKEETKKKDEELTKMEKKITSN